MTDLTTGDDPDLDLFLDKIKNEYKDGWSEENWEEEMEKHPFFMTQNPSENAEELSPAIEGQKGFKTIINNNFNQFFYYLQAIRQLKWDPDESPKEKAIKLKEEGNFYFKCKNYKNAIGSYTKALKEDITNEKELCSTLHSNRAAAHYYIKNYRSALSDSVFARKLNSKNVKAIVKGAECCFQLNLFDDAVKWCNKALEISLKDPKVEALRIECEVKKKTFEKEKRKKEAAIRKKNEKFEKIISSIRVKIIENKTF